MQSLFVHDHKFPKVGNEYLNSYGFDDEFFERYINIFGRISVIGRHKETNEFSKSTPDKANKEVDFLTIGNLKELINQSTRDRIKKKIVESDYIVIRVPSILGLYASWVARKYKKPYIIEVVGCSWDAIVNQGILKLLPAALITILTKKIIRSASRVVYVTEEFLERRYPTNGKFIACSNVTLNEVTELDLQKRLSKIENWDSDNKIVLGTCATIDVIYKGQQDVIKAIANLKKEGYNIEYQLVGGGDNSYLKSIAEKYNVQEQVKFLGALKHEHVFQWLEGVDIYVHPSKQEGLSRAIIEAMSKACPIYGADAGGIHELIDSEYIFKKGNIQQICDIFKNLNKNTMKEQAIKNHNSSKKYLKTVLYNRRKEFLSEFIEDNNN